MMTETCSCPCGLLRYVMAGMSEFLTQQFVGPGLIYVKEKLIHQDLLDGVFLSKFAKMLNVLAYGRINKNIQYTHHRIENDIQYVHACFRVRARIYGYIGLAPFPAIRRFPKILKESRSNFITFKQPW